MEAVKQPAFHIDDPPVHIELTPEQLGALAFIIHSEAYRLFYQPFLVGMLRGFHNQLADPSVERESSKPDHYLRGGIAVITALLNAPDMLLDDERARVEAEAKVQGEQQHYQDRADSGSVGPMGFKYDKSDEEEF